MNNALARWHALEPHAATEEVLPCNGSHAWASILSQRRPYINANALLHAADEVWAALSHDDRQQAFDSHPRIGERHAKAATQTSLQWSTAEQSAAAQDDETVQAALREGNRLYEERFGRIFLVCATGKTAREMLEILNQRLGNDPQAELHEAAEQQRRITQLRLRKWLGLPPARCEDV